MNIKRWNSGGIDKYKRVTLFCIIPTEHYYDFRQKLMNIDNKVFLSSTNCHEVSGGYRKSLVPFSF